MRFYRALRRWHFRPLKQQYGNDPVELFYAVALANILITCSAILLAYTVIFLALDSSIIKPVAKLTNSVIDGVLVSAFSFAYYLLRRGAYKRARDIFIGLAVGGIVASIGLTGGFPTSAVTQCVIVIPVLVYLFYGMRAGSAIALAVPMILALQWLVTHYFGIRLPNVSAETNPALNLFLVTLVVYLLLVCFVAGFEYRQSIMLKELNHERAHLHNQAREDSLTGLANFRHLQEELKTLCAVAKAEKSRLSALYLDLDNFKKINDKHGHAAGDAVLSAVAERLCELADKEDLVARIGGDEFVMLMPSRKPYDTTELLRQILIGRLAEHVQFGEQLLPISASIGKAVFPDDLANPEYLIEAADKDMYRRKQQCRAMTVPLASRA